MYDLKVEAQRDFHKTQGNLKIVTVTADGQTTTTTGSWSSATAQPSSTYHQQQPEQTVGTSTRHRTTTSETSVATPPWSTGTFTTTEGVTVTRRPTISASKSLLIHFLLNSFF
jgi:hypothetical protein